MQKKSILVENINKALLLKKSLLGCDRELFLFLVLILGAIFVLSWSLSSALFSISIFLFSFVLLTQMGKKDLLLRKVYLRQLKYKPFYDNKLLISSAFGGKY